MGERGTAGKTIVQFVTCDDLQTSGVYGRRRWGGNIGRWRRKK